MQLPNDHKVSVSKLSAVFNSTSASYKFYWFLAIIEAIEDGQEHIPKHELFARMMANAWYTVNYFQVSFGKQDKIQSPRLLQEKHLVYSLHQNWFDENLHSKL